MAISTTVTAFVLAAVAVSVQAKQACASQSRPMLSEPDAVTWGHLPHQWEQGQSGYNGAPPSRTVQR